MAENSHRQAAPSQPPETGRWEGCSVLTAFHPQPGLIAGLFWTDGPLGLTGCQRGRMQNLPHDDSKLSRELETGLFLRGDCAMPALTPPADGPWTRSDERHRGRQF